MTFLNVSEIFYSIQGEGKFIGEPAIFLRLLGCNLTCNWCDSSYTWLFSKQMQERLKNNNPNFELEVQNKQDNAGRMSIDKLLKILTMYKINHIVITGGEPLLQQNRLKHLLEYLVFFKVEIETNGTIVPSELTNYHQNIHFNVSPKLSNSFNSKDRVVNNVAMEAFLTYFNSIFKFVVNKPKEIDEVIEFQKYYEIDSSKIWLMPQARTREELYEKGIEIAELAKKYKYNYSHRLQIELYGDRRGH